MKRRLFLVLILISICTTCFADGGRLRFSKPAGPFQVTLFTSPEPLTPGPADFSVMVQDGVSNQVLPDADIQMKITASDGRVVQAHASAGAATNKLLQAAAVTLPTTGIWHLSVLVSEAGRSGICEAEILVEAGSRKASLVWIFSLLPVFLSMLFVLHQKKKSERARPSSAH
jgi:hypothetical protein